jgi:hypothetical protein
MGPHPGFHWVLSVDRVGITVSSDCHVFEKMLGIHWNIGVHRGKEILRHFYYINFKYFDPLLANLALKFRKVQI